MQLRDRLGSAIVLMLIILMWTGFVFAAIYFGFTWTAQAIGTNAAIALWGVGIGAAIAVGMWLASSRHTTAIWRSALSYAADTQELSVKALGAQSAILREHAKADRLTTQAHTQAQLLAYRQQLADDRQRHLLEVRQAQQSEQPAAPSWAMDDGSIDAEAGAGFRFVD